MKIFNNRKLENYLQDGLCISDYNLIKNNVTEIETGIKYENSCLALTTNYKQLKDIKKNAANYKFSFTISLR